MKRPSPVEVPTQTSPLGSAREALASQSPPAIPRALPRADPETAVAIFAQLVDAAILQAVGGADVLDRARSLPRRLEAGEAQRLAVGDADVARASLEQV